jgi:5-formyltetrahydrofolate cyclo-ligase
MMLETKDELREQARLHRDHLPPDISAPEEAAKLFHETVLVAPTQIVAGYWPQGKEFDVRYILDDLLGQGIDCALPIATKDTRVMRFARWRADAPLIKGAFGVMEPETKDYVDPDIVLVPFLAFDRRGYRLGYGGGHYDATLDDLRDRRDVLAVGVGYAEQAVLFNLPVEDHDQPLDLIVTPRGVHDFRK